MLKSHINQLDMYARVLNLFEKEAAVVTQISGFSLLAAELKSKVGNLETEVTRMDRGTDKITENKEVLKFAAAETALSLGKNLELSSSRSNNLLMLNDVTTSYSALTKGPERVIFARMLTNLNMAKTHLEDLKPFGMNEKTLAEAENVINAFNTVSGKPRMILNEVKSERDALKTQFADTNDFFKKQVKNLIECNKKALGSFSSAFENAAQTTARTLKMDNTPAKPADSAKTIAKTTPVAAASSASTSDKPAATSDKPASAPEKTSWKNETPSASV
jgi:hypothetical protein